LIFCRFHVQGKCGCALRHGEWILARRYLTFPRPHRYISDSGAPRSPRSTSRDVRRSPAPGPTEPSAMARRVAPLAVSPVVPEPAASLPRGPDVPQSLLAVMAMSCRPDPASCSPPCPSRSCRCSRLRTPLVACLTVRATPPERSLPSRRR
jgi:hypothetical protein